MKLYHYTNIETLALILKNKTIRFNRLDNVDDLEEGQTASSNIKIGLYTFVSCWTEDPEESIPLWKMYTDKGVGVRIGMKKDMFKKYLYSNGDIICGERLSTNGTVQKLSSPDRIISSNYMICPNFNDGVFYKEVEYVSDVAKAIEDVVKKNPNGTMKIELSKWGIFKNKRWRFQDERRFTLIIFPRQHKIAVGDSKYADWLQYALEHQIPAPLQYFDMELDKEVLDDIEITLCPNMSVGHKIIVESLCKAYLTNVTPKESVLSGKIKLK